MSPSLVSDPRLRLLPCQHGFHDPLDWPAAGGSPGAGCRREPRRRRREEGGGDLGRGRPVPAVPIGQAVPPRPSAGPSHTNYSVSQSVHASGEIPRSPSAPPRSGRSSGWERQALPPRHRRTPGLSGQAAPPSWNCSNRSLALSWTMAAPALGCGKATNRYIFPSSHPRGRRSRSPPPRTTVPAAQGRSPGLPPPAAAAGAEGVPTLIEVKPHGSISSVPPAAPGSGTPLRSWRNPAFSVPPAGWRRHRPSRRSGSEAPRPGWSGPGGVLVRWSMDMVPSIPLSR